VTGSADGHGVAFRFGSTTCDYKQSPAGSCDPYAQFVNFTFLRFVLQEVLATAPFASSAGVAGSWLTISICTFT